MQALDTLSPELVFFPSSPFRGVPTPPSIDITASLFWRNILTVLYHGLTWAAKPVSPFHSDPSSWYGLALSHSLLPGGSLILLHFKPLLQSPAFFPVFS